RLPGADGSPWVADAGGRRGRAHALTGGHGTRASGVVRGQRGPRGPRRIDRAVALLPRADGRTRDRRETGNRRIQRCRLPALHAGQAVLPRTVGSAEPPVSRPPRVDPDEGGRPTAALLRRTRFGRLGSDRRRLGMW